jgi:hypothetical protein
MALFMSLGSTREYAAIGPALLSKPASGALPFSILMPV